MKAHTWRRLTMWDITIRTDPLSKGMTTAPLATVLVVGQQWKNARKGQQKQEKDDIDTITEKIDDAKTFDNEHMIMDQVDAKAYEDVERPVEQEVKISISHDGDYATAICLA